MRNLWSPRGLTVLALSLSLVSILPVTGLSSARAHAGHGAAPASKADALCMSMRVLWQDHVLWTRLFIVSAVADLPDLDATTQRLLQNQTDIGNAVKPYYGEAAGEHLTALLRTHILGAAELLAAAKANDAARLEAAQQAWSANGDEIAAFLSSANPNWPLEDMRSMMRSHLALTLTEAVDQLQGRYVESVADYDRVQVEILDMADMLCEGIIRQFPRQFARATPTGRDGHESAAPTANLSEGLDGAPGFALALGDPSPSPSSGPTRVAFSLPRAGHVSLDVFDTQGRRVRTLVQGTLAAGTHEARWDGRGESGSRVGPGLYFLRLQDGEAQAVSRIVRVD